MQTPLTQQLTHLTAVIELDDLETRFEGDIDVSRFERLPVITQAIRVARRTRSSLTVLCFQSPPSLLTNLRSLVNGSDLERRQAQSRQALFELARKIQEEDGISVHCEGIQTAWDTSVLVDWLTATPTDLLILAKPDNQAVTAMTMSGLSQLIRQTGMPVWFSDENSRPQHGVVAALSDGIRGEDGELRALDHEVLDTARGVSRLFETRLHLVQASECPQPSFGTLGMAGLGRLDAGTAGADMIAATRPDVRERLRGRKQALETFARATGAADELAQIVVGEGDPAAVVADRAEALDAGLIIMGATEKSSWETLLKGGTAEETLTLAPCDVLYVKHADREDVRPQAVLSLSALRAQPETHEVDMIVHPRRHFATPLTVLRDESLPRQTKVMVLEAWEEELNNEVRNEQRMPQQVYEPAWNPAELDQVLRALERLGVDRQAA